MLPRPDSMLRYLIVDILLPLLVFAFLRSIFRSIFQTGRDVLRQTPPPSRPDVVAGGELKKDPVCGMYIAAATSVKKTVGGQTVHFCSQECRNKYVATMAR